MERGLTVMIVGANVHEEHVIRDLMRHVSNPRIDIVTPELVMDTDTTVVFRLRDFLDDLDVACVAPIPSRALDGLEERRWFIVKDARPPRPPVPKLTRLHRKQHR